MNGLAGPRQEHVEDRQGPVDRPLVQLRLHVAGDEEAETEQRTKRGFEVAQRSIDRRMTEAGELRNIANRFETGQNVGRRIGKKRSGVKKIRTAEHVQHGVMIVGQLLAGERPNLGKRGAVLARENRIEIVCVLLPELIFRKRRERRVGRWWQPSQESGGVVGGRRFGASRWSRAHSERDRHRCSRQNLRHGYEHVF